MKQKGKTWYTQKGEATLAKYVPPFLQACERIGQKIGQAAEDIEKRLSEAKYDFHKLCMEAYNEYLKTGQPVKRFSFLTFDKMIKVEFDVNEGYIRAYRATKKDPTHKDYELINTDFSSSIMKGLPKNEEEANARLAERVYVPGIDDGSKNLFKHPLTPNESFQFWTEEELEKSCYLICDNQSNPDMFNNIMESMQEHEEVTVSAFDVLPKIAKKGDCYVAFKGEVAYLYKLKAVNSTPKEPIENHTSTILDFAEDGKHFSITVDCPTSINPKDGWMMLLENGLMGYIKKALKVGENVNPRYYTLDVMVVKSTDYDQFKNGLKESGKVALFERAIAPSDLALLSIVDEPKASKKKKPAKEEESPDAEDLSPCLCGQKSISDCLNACLNLGPKKVDSMLNH